MWLVVLKHQLVWSHPQKAGVGKDGAVSKLIKDGVSQNDGLLQYVWQFAINLP